MIGHALAYHLHKSFGVKAFSAYVNLRANYEFLSAQDEVLYTSLLLDEDVHRSLYGEKTDMAYLKWFENKYGIPNLWPYLYIDRVLMSGQYVREYPHDRPILTPDEMLRAIQVTSKAIIQFLEKEKPDAVVIAVIGSMGSMLLYHIAQKMGIKTINIEITRIKNRVALSEDYRTFTWAKKVFQEIQQGKRLPTKNKDAKDFLDEFRTEPKPYHKQAEPESNKQIRRLGNLYFLLPKNLSWSIWWHLAQIYKKFRRRDYTDELIWTLIWDKLKRKIRGLVGYLDLYHKVDLSENFAFFPLQYEPEITTLLYAPSYTNQINVIRQVARSMPIYLTLYVKEHPAMVGYRTHAYYKEILKNPNVRLINPKHRGNELIRHAKLVMTITATSGLEGMLLKKPVITFGDVFYNDLSFVKRCRSFEDLPYLIKEQLEHFEHNEKELVNYLSALFEESTEVDYLDLWYTLWLNKESIETIKRNLGIKNLAGLIAKKLGLSKQIST